MMNALRMDIFRMVRSVSTWVILGALAVLTTLTVLLAAVTLQTLEKAADADNAAAQSFQAGYEIGSAGASGIMDEVNVSSDITDVISSAESMVKTSFLATALGAKSNYLILMAIFIALFVSAETKTGFIKNIAGHVKNRGTLIFTKIITAFIFNIMLITVGTGSVYIGQLLFVGAEGFTPFGEILFVDGIFFLLTMAFAALVTLVTVTLRNAAGGLVTGIVLAAGLGALIFSLLDKGINSLFGTESFSVTEYTITGNNLSVSTALEQSDIIRMICVGAAGLVIYTVISMIIYKKRDVK